MSERTQAQVVTEIHREREELVSAVAGVRRDMTRDIAQLKERAMRQLPKVAAAASLAIGVLVALRIRKARRRVPEATVRLRVGRFSLIERSH
jgi:hypothetical protein